MNYDRSLFEKPLIGVPTDASEWPAFGQALRNWKADKLQDLQYDAKLYEREDLKWMAAGFTLVHIMMNDEEFYSPTENRYLVDEFLDRGERDFGGYDCALLWHAYPRIGVDDRNQFDFYRQSPGGLKGLRELVAQMQARGVKVFIDYNPWDTGTRREPTDDTDAIVALVREIQVDGVFLDTMEVGAEGFREKLDAARLGVVLEPEGMTPMEGIQHQHASYGQGFDYCWPNVHGRAIRPGILRNKFLEPRHMVHQTFRWAHDHSDELHTAWLNGSGMMVWENVFGSWFSWNELDKSRWSSMVPVLRRFCHVVSGPGWEPLVPCHSHGIAASRWSLDSLTLFTVTNRGDAEVDGPWFSVDHRPGARWFELITGQELTPVVNDGKFTINSSLEVGGVAAVLGIPAEQFDKSLSQFLSDQAAKYAGWNRDTAHVRPEIKRRPKPSNVVVAPAAEGFAYLPAQEKTVTVTFRRRECGDYERVFSNQIDNPWTNGLHHTFHVEREVSLLAYGIQLLEVSNAEFREFLLGSGYQPLIAENFLRHWADGSPAPGSENEPVVWVDLDDARAYAEWRGLRLPDEFEWQIAAESGLIERRSPLVWNWTESVHSDGHTRFCMLKGGAAYQAEGSEWYTDGGPREPDFSVKFQLWWPGLDRCATVGFRCAAVVAEP